MKYKLMSDMTKEEIEYILKKVCELEYNVIDSIEYNKKENSIDITVLETWTTKDDNDILVNIEDTEDITLSNSEINFEHGQMEDAQYRYKQYILAKGYYYLLKDNQYL